MSQRLERVNALVKRELGALIDRDFDFPGVLVTINSVDVTPNLRNAHVFVGMIGEKRQMASAIDKLNARRGWIQGRLARRVILKYTPHLHFKADDSVARGVNIVDIIDSLEIPPAEVDGDDDPLFYDEDDQEDPGR
jgi:ribosome-binding factor A